MAYPGQPKYGPPPYDQPGYCPAPPPTVLYQAVPVGNCPACRQGFLQSSVTCLGVFCAIIFFPIGLICLFALQEQRCSVCGYCTQ